MSRDPVSGIVFKSFEMLRPGRGAPRADDRPRQIRGFAVSRNARLSAEWAARDSSIARSLSEDARA